MTPPPASARSDGAVALLSRLTEDELASADQRYPKWATMCQLRRIGLPVLNAVLLTPGRDHRELEAAITALTAATGRDQLMVRSDGGVEAHRYYKGGNTFPLAEGASKATGLLEAGRAVILMEPTNRFTNRLTALLRMDRDSRGRDGTFTAEALGPGYDVADLTRGGIPPQVTVTVDVAWPAYPDLWWSDLRMTTYTSPDAEHDCRTRRLARIAADVLTDTGHLPSPSMTAGEQAAAAEAWLRKRGHDQLWQDYDTATAVARRIRSWFDDAFMIAACHPRRGWTCLATATSDLGDRHVYWDIVDGSHKYATGRRA
jgi:hypothetical protein